MSGGNKYILLTVKLVSTEAIFLKFKILIFCDNTSEKIQVSLKYYNNNVHFTYGQSIFIIAFSLNSFYNEDCFGHICMEYQNTHFIFTDVFPKIVPFNKGTWKNVVEAERPQI